jgi:DNA-binding HxlR family transcriptional regulator
MNRMRPYAQYCPIAKAAEVLGDRWSLLIVRDMIGGTARFNDLVRGLPGISRAILAKRLRQLEAAGLVNRTADGWALTPAGRDLEPLVFMLAEWGAKHAFGDPIEEELDPDLLMWWMHGRIAPDPRPDRTTVVQFEFTDRAHRYWLVVEPADVSVCLTDPGFEIDAVVRTELRTMYLVWLGRRDLLGAVRAGDITFEGAQHVIRSLPGWLQLSPVAPIVRAADAGVEAIAPG